MQSQRWAWTHTYAVPLFVTSLVALLLAGAGWTAVLVFEHGDSGPSDPAATGPSPAGDRSDADSTGGAPAGGDQPGTSTGPTAGAEPGEIDDCVVGAWRLVEHTETVAMDALYGAFTLVEGVPVIEYRADGSAQSDYHDGSRFEVALGIGDPVLAQVAGQVHYRYEASAGTMRYFDIRSEATLTLELLDVPFSYQDAPFRYECSGDTMVFNNPERGFQARLHRR